MCNIAGYIGNRRAAPILIEMMQREEGLYAGHYTGISTIYEGKIYTEKVVGSVERLLRRTNAMDLPGNIGIIHGRTPGPGDREWAHPFMSNDGRIAICENGAIGKYEETQHFDAVLERLRKEGVHYDSLAPDDGKYRKVDDTHIAHGSDVMTQFFRSLMKSDGLSLSRAMEKAMEDFAEEIVVLGLDREDPEAISFLRVNCPMMVSRNANEVYLATSAIAFPEGQTEATVLPPSSSGRITVEETQIHHFQMCKPIEPTDPKMMIKYEKLLEEMVRNSPAPLKFSKLMVRAGEFYPEDKVLQRAQWAYEIIWKWHNEGRLVLTPYTVKYRTLDEEVETDVVQFGISLKE